jgi:membrane carboxypeptidase/penicillin-binding protein
MGHGITGTRGAIPIWAPIMTALHRDLPEKKFTYSSGLETREVCSISHGLATIYCPGPYNEMFLQGVLPEVCQIHSPTKRRDTSNVLDFFGTQSSPSRNSGGSGGGLMF